MSIQILKKGPQGIAYLRICGTLRSFFKLTPWGGRKEVVVTVKQEKTEFHTS